MIPSRQVQLNGVSNRRPAGPAGRRAAGRPGGGRGFDRRPAARARSRPWWAGSWRSCSRRAGWSPWWRAGARVSAGRSQGRSAARARASWWWLAASGRWTRRSASWSAAAPAPPVWPPTSATARRGGVPGQPFLRLPHRADDLRRRRILLHL